MICFYARTRYIFEDIEYGQRAKSGKYLIVLEVSVFRLPILYHNAMCNGADLAVDPKLSFYSSP